MVKSLYNSLSIVYSSACVGHNSSWCAGLTYGRTFLYRYCCRSSVRPGGIISSGSSVASEGVAPLFVIDIGFSTPSIRSFKYTVQGSSAVTLKWWNRLIPLTARNWLNKKLFQNLHFQAALWKETASFEAADLLIKVWNWPTKSTSDLRKSFRMWENPLSTRHLKWEN